MHAGGVQQQGGQAKDDCQQAVFITRVKVGKNPVKGDVPKKGKRGKQEGIKVEIAPANQVKKGDHFKKQVKTQVGPETVTGCQETSPSIGIDVNSKVCKKKNRVSE